MVQIEDDTARLDSEDYFCGMISVGVCDENTAIRFATRSIFELFDISEAKLTGMSASEFLRQHTPAYVLKAFRRAIRTGTPVKLLAALPISSKSKDFFSLSFAPSTQNKVVTRCFVLIRNVDAETAAQIEVTRPNRIRLPGAA